MTTSGRSTSAMPASVRGKNTGCLCAPHMSSSNSALVFRLTSTGRPAWHAISDWCAPGWVTSAHVSPHTGVIRSSWTVT